MKEERTRKEAGRGAEKKFSSWAEKLVAANSEHDRICEEVALAEQAADEAFRSSEVGKAFGEFDTRISKMSHEEVIANRAEIDLREDEAMREHEKYRVQFHVFELADKRQEATQKLLKVLDCDEAEKLISKKNPTQLEKKALALYNMWTYNPD